MLVDANGNQIETKEVVKTEGEVLKGIPEVPYFAVEIKTFTDSAHRQVIQRAVVDGTPPPDFYTFQGIGLWDFVIPESNPPRIHKWEFMFEIENAETIQQAYANFNGSMNGKEQTETAYMAFKTECAIKRAEFEAKKKMMEQADLQRRKAQVEASTPNLARMKKKKNGK